MNDAEHAVVSVQRRSDEGLDPLLAQDRVQDVRVVDVSNHDRPLLGRDSSSETLAERNAHSALNLLLEPLGRSRDQVLSLGVEEQDRARVGFEQITGPHEQLVEQFIQRELGQRDVGDGLEAAHPADRPLQDEFERVTRALAPRMLPHGHKVLGQPDPCL